MPMAKKEKIRVFKGKNVSKKTGKEYTYYVLKVGLFEHMFFPSSKVESAYLDKIITDVAQDEFQSDEDLDEDEKKALDDIGF